MKNKVTLVRSLLKKIKKEKKLQSKLQQEKLKQLGIDKTPKKKRSSTSRKVVCQYSDS